MTAPPYSCTSCATPLPADAQFCPRCGTRTPTQVSGGTTTLAEPVAPDALAEQRERLQRALRCLRIAKGASGRQVQLEKQSPATH